MFTLLYNEEIIMKLLTIAGFLGSGKTSILLSIAKFFINKHGLKIAIIENEIGEKGGR